MAEQSQREVRLLRIRQVIDRCGLSRSTIYDRVKKGSFPQPVSLTGVRAVGWVESELEEHLARLIEHDRHSRGGPR